MRYPESSPNADRRGTDGGSSRPEFSSFLRRTFLIVAIVLLLALLWYAVDVLMLLFAGILLAVFLRGMSDWLSEHTRLAPGWSLAVVTLAIVLVCGAGGWLLAPEVARQTDELVQTIPQSLQQLRQQIQQYEWGRQLLQQAQNTEQLPAGGDIAAQAASFFSTTLGVLADFVIILFVGLYLAADPGQYVNGMVRLVPFDKRERAREVIHAAGYTLRWWLIGRFFEMVVIGVLTTLGLWLLGVPLALTLGILSALLAFVPYIGPIVSVIPPVLLALLEGPTLALYVLILYIAIQTVESYLLTPLVQQQVVDLPPVLTIISQVLLGVLLGAMGVILATPLAAVALVLVKMLYVRDVLGDAVDVPGAEGS